MVSDTYDETAIFAAKNTQLDSHPYWSALAAYADSSSSGVDICNDESTSAECQIVSYCDFMEQFSTMEAVLTAEVAGLVDPVCSSYYTLQVLSDTLSIEVTNYTKVNEGYDGVFGDYVDYVKRMVSDALNKFMAVATGTTPGGGPGQQFLNCEYSSESQTITQPCPIPVSNPGYMTTSLKIASSSIHVLTFRISGGQLFSVEVSTP